MAGVCTTLPPSRLIHFKTTLRDYMRLHDTCEGCSKTGSWSVMICVLVYHCVKIPLICSGPSELTHWGRVTHICVIKLTIIGSDNGLSPDRRQAIFWTNTALLLIGPLGTNFSEILIEILTFSFKKRRLKVSSAKRRPFCLGLNVITMLTRVWQETIT